MEVLEQALEVPQALVQHQSLVLLLNLEVPQPLVDRLHLGPQCPAQQVFVILSLMLLLFCIVNSLFYGTSTQVTIVTVTIKHKQNL